MKARFKGMLIGIGVLVFLLILPTLSGELNQLLRNIGEPCEIKEPPECTEELCPVHEVKACKNAGYYLSKPIPRENNIEFIRFVLFVPSLVLLSVFGMCKGEFCNSAGIVAKMIAFIFPFVIFALAGYGVGRLIEKRRKKS